MVILPLKRNRQSVYCFTSIATPYKFCLSAEVSSIPFRIKVSQDNLSSVALSRELNAFGKFEEAGVIDRASGDAFRREVLAVGASRPALESFVAFRGREPRPDALLASYGLA